MAKRKRHRKPGTAPRSSHLSKKSATRRKRHGKSFHMSESTLPIVGKISFQPTLKGAIGGAAVVASNMVSGERKILGIPIRILTPFVLSIVASKMKQPLIAAGLAGAGVVMVGKDVFGLSEGFTSTPYADPKLLQDGGVTFYDPGTNTHYKLNADECRTLSEQALLSDGNPYGPGTFLGRMGDPSLLSREEEE